MILTTAGCSTSGSSAPTTESAAAQRNDDRLSGTCQLTRGVVNGKSVPVHVARNTILITDHNTFLLPKASGIGTHPQGPFTGNPDTKPKQVDSIAEGGPHVGQVTRGVYEILDAIDTRLLGNARWTAADRVQVLLREADGFFNIGRKLDRCPPVRNTSNSVR